MGNFSGPKMRDIPRNQHDEDARASLWLKIEKVDCEGALGLNRDRTRQVILVAILGKKAILTMKVHLDN